MKNKHHILIAGAGGIGQALALILAEYSEEMPVLYIGNRNPAKAVEAARFVKAGATRRIEVLPFHLPEEGLNHATLEVLHKAEILLDCLPGGQAPRMAKLALDHGLHYANMTEYVQETNEIVALAAHAAKGFALQCGLAPGYIDVLAHGMFREFCEQHGVDHADYIGMKVGALTRHASAPHFYGFTWSPVGVATEYVKDAVCVRDYLKQTVPALSGLETILVDGRIYEANLTSGGAADLPDALEGKVKKLDYKTLRYPGHYAWVQSILDAVPKGEDKIAFLQQRMESAIPHVEDDCVILHACVEGRDAHGTLRKTEQGFSVLPQRVGRHTLRAIQTTTAAPLAETARLLLEESYAGVVYQSQLDPDSFLNGIFIRPFYYPHASRAGRAKETVSM